jgi:hypothetical protein
VLLVALAVVLLCAGALAVYTLTNGVDRLTAQIGSLFPAPTDTPVPTATPEAPAATDGTSLDQFLTAECSAALDHLGRLSDQITEDPTTPLDSTWRKELTDAVGAMRSACGSLESASPVPGQVSEVQQNLAQADSDFDEATRLFNEGVDELNPGKIIEAGRHVQSATKHLNEAVTLLRSLGR